ncbi:hypothetical protein AMATHDRAFT_72647 [Amanita thiersii Skay4041]|uniref:protein-ribulosamine 3-kinase n=1 Tax=Amanita thiersii Skay4041 TaxID=703135 RepID=A0A2A9P122_9AGAR|nr:hypothetical protein AMATHDRAFT_72647 [Amanita thiersii Skay4041]
MIVHSSIPSVLLELLKQVEPEAEFGGSLPKVKSSTGNTYFAKIGSHAELEQYTGETESLKAINTAAPGLAPKVLSSGCLEDGRPYLITEYKEVGSLTDKTGSQLGKRLATELHAYQSSSGFGFGVPTFCGATKQDNGWYATWEKCFCALYEGLLAKLRRKGHYADLCHKGEEVKDRVVPKLLGPLNIQPVLLHGDLWSGNIGVDKGLPFVFDPSSYFGHGEADLAIGRMFGGIPQSFFTTYHEYIPRTEPIDQYELRGELYELYHYLNHTVIFGGGYAGSALRKMERLLSASL